MLLWFHLPLLVEEFLSLSFLLFLLLVVVVAVSSCSWRLFPLTVGDANPVIGFFPIFFLGDFGGGDVKATLDVPRFFVLGIDGFAFKTLDSSSEVSWLEPELPLLSLSESWLFFFDEFLFVAFKDVFDFDLEETFFPEIN